MSQREIQQRLIAQRERERQVALQQQEQQRAPRSLPQYSSAAIQQEQVRRVRQEQKRRFEAGLEKQAHLFTPPLPQDARTASTAETREQQLLRIIGGVPEGVEQTGQIPLIPLSALRQPPTGVVRPQRSYPTPPQSEESSESVAVGVVNQMLVEPTGGDAVRVVHRSKWNEPAEMAETYAFLYNTIDTLFVQMDERLWMNVYAEPPMRNRKLNWTRLEDARRIVFASRRAAGGNLEEAADEEPDEYDENDYLSGAVTLYQGGAKRRMITESSFTQPNVSERFNVPPATYDRTLRRWFAVQKDGYLCSVHSLNNVMNRIAFAPPDVLSTIELLRPLENRFAQLEEVILAALREGIFLLQLRLTAVSDLTALHDQSEFPKQKKCLEFLKRAGGMLVYQPGDAGHFSSLVYSDDPAIAPTQPRWGVYSSTAVVSYGSTAASALEKYIFGSNTFGISNPQSIERERHKRAAGVQSEVSRHFIGLLPISLALLTDDTRSESSGGSGSDQRLSLRVARTLVRRALSETVVIDIGGDRANVQRSEINVPLPMSPSNFDAISREVTANNLSGLEQTNPASLFFARFYVDQELNQRFDNLARLLLERFDGIADDMSRRDIVQTLSEIRGTLIEQRLIGLFFTNSGSSNESFRKFIGMHSNRRWFRYLVLFVTVDAVQTQIAKKREIPAPPPGTPAAEDPRNDPLNDDWVTPFGREIMRLLILCCIVGFNNMSALGVRLATTPHISRLTSHAYSKRSTLLPLNTAPLSISRLLTVPGGGDDRWQEFNSFVTLNRYELSLWLAETAYKMDFEQFGLPSIEPLRLSREARERVADEHAARTPQFNSEDFLALDYDDTSEAYDQVSEFVTLLRATLFMMPFAGNEFNAIKSRIAQVFPNQPTPLPLAEHMNSVGQAFIVRTTTQIDDDPLPFAGIHNEMDATRWIDSIAFDRRFATNNAWRIAASMTLQPRQLSVTRPRFFERALQLGFDRIYRELFGILTLTPDQRPVIVNNPARVPPFDADGNLAQEWHKVQVSVGPEVQLTVRPISDLNK